MTLAQRFRVLHAATAVVLALSVGAWATLPAGMDCGASCPCEDGDTVAGSDHHDSEHLASGADHEHEAMDGDHHDTGDDESGDPCDEDCPDDCPLCHAVVTALVMPALVLPVQGGTWHVVDATDVRDTVHRRAITGVFRPPRLLG